MRVGGVGNRVLRGFPSRGGRVLCVHGDGSVHARVHSTLLGAVKRSPYTMANWLRALRQKLASLPQVAVMLRSANQINLVAVWWEVGLVGREVAAGLENLAEPRVHTLQGVGGVERLAHVGRKRKKRDHV